MTKFNCKFCGYSLEKTDAPDSCPYCGRKNAFEKEESAEEITSKA